MAIHLSGLPGSGAPGGAPGGPSVSLFDLAPGGVYRADRVTPAAGALLPHRFTLTCARPGGCAIGGLFSVALSCRSPRLAVNQHPALWSPDLPRPEHVGGVFSAGSDRDHPAGSPSTPSSHMRGVAVPEALPAPGPARVGVGLIWRRVTRSASPTPPRRPDRARCPFHRRVLSPSRPGRADQFPARALDQWRDPIGQSAASRTLLHRPGRSHQCPGQRCPHAEREVLVDAMAKCSIHARTIGHRARCRHGGAGEG